MMLHVFKSALHFHGHVNAGYGVFLDPLGIGVPKEEHNRVANVLVDGSTVAQGDFRHGAQIQI